MSTAAKWVDYDPDETYDLTTAFPKLQLPLLAIPEEINAVPMVYRFIGLSKNKHALNLHSGMIGAFLDQEPLPTARLVSRSIDHLPSNQHTAQPPSLVVPNYDFPARIHDEDYRYERLMAGFMDLDDDLVLPIQLSNPDVEA
ncbi:2456_t:CDS:2, partial [Entrophospora sp. SA101]